MWISRKIVSLLACVYGFVGSAVAAPAGESSNVAALAAPVVTISPGVVIGKTTVVTSAPSSTATVLNYLGVPFAAVPTGTRRFAPPVATSWVQPVMATALPSACRQQFLAPPYLANNLRTVFNNPNGPPPPESEDCLYLNIYAPLNASSTNRKPVMFWIYGGAFQLGSNYLNYYNGSSFAGFQDVVVVVANYRTNIFGFSSSPELPSGQRNAGLLDQRLALRWVQQNIGGFGGDPGRVTVFGESAGANCVKQLLTLPPADPRPFSAAILESQGYGTGPPQMASYAATAAHFGCATDASPLACLRRVDGAQLVAYISDSDLLFPPDADNTTYTYDVRPSIARGRFADVPVLLGTNAQEARVFLRAGIPDVAGNASETLRDALMPLFGRNDTLVGQLVGAYGGDGTAALFDAVSAVLTDFLFTCPTSRLADAVVVAGTDAWRYYYNASYPNLQYLPDIGVYHSSEIPQVWGTYPVRNALGAATPGQIGLSRYMQTVWANFAKDPALGAPWPKLTANLAANRMGEMGGRNPTGETTIPVAGVDARCPLFDPIYAVLGL